MLRRSLKMLVLGVGVAIGAAPALAQGVPATAAPPASVQYANVEFEASIGIMQGEANEYVYPRVGHKISQLVWAFDNNPVLNLGAAFRPLDWLALGIRARFNIGDESKMDDYDWLPSCPNNFCHSWHRFTELEQYVSVDAYVAAKFYETSWINLKALAGWKRDSARWYAFDGNSNYTPAEPNRPAIYYNQVWNAPYLGLQANAEWERWTLQGRVIGSWWVYGQDEDIHYLRTTCFRRLRSIEHGRRQRCPRISAHREPNAESRLRSPAVGNGERARQRSRTMRRGSTPSRDGTPPELRASRRPSRSAQCSPIEHC